MKEIKIGFLHQHSFMASWLNSLEWSSSRHCLKSGRLASTTTQQ